MKSVLPCILIMAISVAIVVYIIHNKRAESFGSTSPGTMVQLQTSHVPKDVYPKHVKNKSMK